MKKICILGFTFLIFSITKGQVKFDLQHSELNNTKGQIFSVSLVDVNVPIPGEIITEAKVNDSILTPQKDGHDYEYKTWKDGEFIFSMHVEVKFNNNLVFDSVFSLKLICYTLDKNTVLPLGALYKGIDNPLSIMAPGYEPDMLTVNLQSRGSLFKMSASNYKLALPQNCDTAIIMVTSKNPSNGASVVINRYILPVFELPKPRFELSHPIDSVDLNFTVQLRPVFPEKLNHILGVEVYQFHCKWNDWNEELRDYEIRGYSIGGKVLMGIKNAPKGTKIHITDIQYIYKIGDQITPEVSSFNFIR